MAAIPWEEFPVCGMEILLPGDQMSKEKAGDGEDGEEKEESEHGPREKDEEPVARDMGRSDKGVYKAPKEEPIPEDPVPLFTPDLPILKVW